MLRNSSTPSASNIGFIAYARTLIAECHSTGRISAAAHYSAALSSFTRFHGQSEVPFRRFTHSLVSAYEAHLTAAGLCPNTTSYYMRKLRAIYNRAVDSGIAIQRNPFSRVYTGIAKTVKRALPIDVVRRLNALKLPADHHDALARDMFMISFYLRGASLIDMASLRRSNLRNGILTYRRRKTGQTITIRWEPAMQTIVSRHLVEGSDYLLPILRPGGLDTPRHYRNMLQLINTHLKSLGRQLGLATPLTMYCARHSWASIARDHNVPISVISQGLGHDSEKTTRIYLSTIDTTVVDNANSTLISLIDHEFKI